MSASIDIRQLLLEHAFAEDSVLILSDACSDDNNNEVLVIFVLNNDDDREALEKRDMRPKPSTIGKFADVLTEPGVWRKWYKGLEQIQLSVFWDYSHLSFL